MEVRLPELWRQQEELFRKGGKNGNNLIGLRVAVFLENAGDFILFPKSRVERAAKRVNDLKIWLNLE